MLKKQFFGLAKPSINYEKSDVIAHAPMDLPTPDQVTLLFEEAFDQHRIMALKVGDSVKTGQRLEIYADSDNTLLSTVSGSVTAIYPYTGDLGRRFTAVTIAVDTQEAIDEAFKKASPEPTLETLTHFFSGIPGAPVFSSLSDPDSPINTIVVSGADQDLLVSTQQHVVKSRFHDLEKGVGILKTATEIEEIVLVVHREFIQGYSEIEAKVMAVASAYPAASPHMIAADLLGRVVPAGKRLEDVGICFMDAEAVASIGQAFNTGQLPVTKTLTLIGKTGEKHLVSARIGTPVKDICSYFKLAVKNKDRIISGGPLTGTAIYSEDDPVKPDTDAIIIQDSGDIASISDSPCVNCGECIRMCPARVPVDMLVRFLEAGFYAEAADEYDLYSCIECGLCSFVCISKIPISQYIRLGKYELDRINAAEGS